MPWSDFVCIIQKFHFFAELVSPSVGIVVHTDQDLLLRCTSSLDIWRTGDPWFNLPSIWEESLTNKSLQSNNELTHLLPTEPALTPADFKWALCRSRCLPVTRSGLAGDSLTIHLPLCTSQLSCPENRNTNSVSMLRSLFLRLPPPLHLGSVSLSFNSAMWLENLASNGLYCERPSQVPAESGLNKSKPFTQARWA